jgi:hypothetical protein
MGVFYHWTPSEAKRRFRILTDSGLKGTGDYGLFAVGLYNGQSANRPEANNSLHAVARLAYPFQLPNGQLIEANLAAYTGRFVLFSRTAGVPAAPEFRDERVAVSLIVFPQPFGLQAEWNLGTGPEFAPTSRTVVDGRVRGGYVQAMYRARPGNQVVTPYARLQYFDGGKKGEQDARLYDVHEVEAGLEWLPIPSLELTAAITNATRTVADGSLTAPNRQEGRFLRLQAQVNY